MKRTDGSTGFRISTLEDAPGVTWVAGDELPSELLLLVWRRFCAARLLVCISCVCFVSLLVYFCFPLPPSMGQRLTTPLSLTLGHWKEVKDRANNLSVKVRRKKWQTLFSSEWPTLDVKWPQDGTFNRLYLTGQRASVRCKTTWIPQPSPLRNYLGEPGTRPPPPWVAPFVTKKPRVPNATAMVPMAPPIPVLPLPPLRKRKIRGQTKASPPARGPGLDCSFV